MSRTRDFRDSILESDVIIYDLMSNEFTEVDYVIKTLKTSKLTKEKTLIILSSVMTWVNTLPKFKSEEEEEGDGGGEEGEGEDSDEFTDGEEWNVEDSDEQPAEGEDEDPDAPKAPEV
jgi:hypothetical protein